MEKIYKLEHEYISFKSSNGLMSDAYKEINGELKIVGNRPIVGTQLIVGQSLDSQNWLKCSTIKNLLIDEDNYVKFKTENSIYQWWSFTKEEVEEQNR